MVIIKVLNMKNIDRSFPRVNNDESIYVFNFFLSEHASCRIVRINMNSFFTKKMVVWRPLKIQFFLKLSRYYRSIIFKVLRQDSVVLIFWICISNNCIRKTILSKIWYINIFQLITIFGSFSLR